MRLQLIRLFVYCQSLLIQFSNLDKCLRSRPLTNLDLLFCQLLSSRHLAFHLFRNMSGRKFPAKGRFNDPLEHRSYQFRQTCSIINHHQPLSTLINISFNSPQPVDTTPPSAPLPHFLPVEGLYYADHQQHLRKFPPRD